MWRGGGGRRQHSELRPKPGKRRPRGGRAAGAEEGLGATVGQGGRIMISGGLPQGGLVMAGCVAVSWWAGG